MIKHNFSLLMSAFSLLLTKVKDYSNTFKLAERFTTIYLVLSIFAASVYNLVSKIFNLLKRNNELKRFLK